MWVKSIDGEKVLDIEVVVDASVSVCKRTAESVVEIKDVEFRSAEDYRDFIERTSQEVKDILEESGAFLAARHMRHDLCLSKSLALEVMDMLEPVLPEDVSAELYKELGGAQETDKTEDEG